MAAAAKHASTGDATGAVGLLTIQSIIGEEAPALNVDSLYLLFFSALAD